ncbi:winged-helix domain-containing protein, partial [Staphylococcus saprophyticus]|uniref:winged-helix domain-containing protein n=1 Tax=Staphylococcus saprophyticus TaxID=29385 RepID=UPI003703E0E8
MPNQTQNIPPPTFKRLPLYYTFLNTLKSKPIHTLNSKPITQPLNIHSPTIPTHFSYFPQLPKNPYPYNIH